MTSTVLTRVDDGVATFDLNRAEGDERLRRR